MFRAKIAPESRMRGRLHGFLLRQASNRHCRFVGSFPLEPAKRNPRDGYLARLLPGLKVESRGGNPAQFVVITTPIFPAILREPRNARRKEKTLRDN